MYCPFCNSPISATDIKCISCNNLLTNPSDRVRQSLIKVKSALGSLLFAWVLNLVLVGFVSFLLLIFGVPIIVFLKTGVIQLIPEISLVYNAIVFTFIAAISTGTVLWVFALFKTD